MEIEIATQYDNYIDSKAEKAIFGENKLNLSFIKIREEGIYVKTNYGVSFDTLLIPAKKCVVKGKIKHFTFDSEEIEKFMENAPFASRQATNKRNHVLEVKHTLEQTMGIKIHINDSLKITGTEGKALGYLFVGYDIIDIIKNADLAVNAVSCAFRKSEKIKDDVKKQFHKDMKERGIIRDYYD
jgi:hypothetical protein